MRNRKSASIRKGAGLGLAAAGLLGGSVAALGSAPAAHATDPTTTTPIKHVVVLFDENISFDHYFGTYPYAAGTDGVPFKAAADTLTRNTITNYTSAPGLLARPGTQVSGSPIPGANGTAGSNPNSQAPFRLGMGQQWICSQKHGYLAEQQGMDGDATTGVPAMDKFPEFTSSANNCANTAAPAPAGNLEFEHNGMAMSYVDGNVVTGLWNYAQHYAMSDNSWADNFGPSTVGAVNVVSGQTGGAVMYAPNANGSADGSHPALLTNTSDPSSPVAAIPGEIEGTTWVDPADHSKGTMGAITGDPTPAFDMCSDASVAASMTGRNVGDLLNDRGVSWGSFMGGFRSPSLPADASHSDVCTYKSPTNPDGGAWMAANRADYVPHHAPFQYFESTANPNHTAPSGGAEIGHAGAANHEYDLSWFYKAVGNQDGAQLPAVSYLRPIEGEDGHGGNSDPVDEQHFLVRTINAIEKSSYWKDTAIVIAYDDSDGFYDQVAPTITNGSSDATANTTVCTKAPTAGTPAGGWQDRCGPSQRLPFLVISPYAKQNYIDHSKTSQASVVRFIEDNWLGGQGVDTTATTGAFDRTAGTISTMFDFGAAPHPAPVLLRPDGTVAAGPRVVPPAPALSAGNPGLHGRFRVGKRVRVSISATRGATLRYQWLADGRALRGATHSSLRLAQRLTGTRVSVRVTVSYAGHRPSSIVRTTRARKVRT